MNIIETQNLTKSYADFTAVSNVNLHIPKGAVYGFLGPNGAGKSTTMKMFLGLTKPSSGSFTIDGKKYPLPHPEIRSFVSQVPWSYTSKSLVSYTEVPCFKAHPKTARLSSPVGVSTSSSLSANRSPAAPSLTPGLPPPIWTTVSRPIPASNPARKGPPIPATRNF